MAKAVALILSYFAVAKAEALVLSYPAAGKAVAPVTPQPVAKALALVSLHPCHSHCGFSLPCCKAAAWAIA